MDVGFKFLDFNPRAEYFNPYEAATVLDQAHQRIDTFTQELVQSFCRRKGMRPPDPDDVASTGGIISRILVRGIERVSDCIDENYPLTSCHNLEQHAFLPSTLLMLGARLASASLYEEVGEGILEASAAQETIDSTIDRALQEACSKIIRNEKHFVPKGKDAEGERIFAACMNCLRTLYHTGKERGFQSSLMTHFYYAFKPDFEDFKLSFGDTEAEYDADGFADEWFRRIAARFNPTLGTDFEIPPDKVALVVNVERRSDEFLGKKDYANDKAFSRVFNKMFSVRAARHFVDAIAAGEIQYSKIMQAMMALREQPLSGF